MTEAWLQCDKEVLSSFAEAITVITSSCASQYDESLITKCCEELVGKLINLCKKNWDVCRRRHVQHEKGRKTNVSLNLRDKLKAHVSN